MIYCFDIDGTICSSVKNSDYQKAEPFKDVIDEINHLYESGHKIIFMTARGSVSGKDWTELTKSQLKKWNVQYHELIMNKKPHADLFIDDKAKNIVDWRREIHEKKSSNY